MVNPKFLYKRFVFRSRIRKGKKNNKIKFDGNFFNCSLELRGCNNEIIVEKGCHLQNVFFKISGENHTVIIKKGVSMKSGLVSIEGNSNELLIDEDSTFEGVHIGITEVSHKVLIGKDCMLSNGITIRNGDSHPIFDKKTNKRINSAGNVIIKNHVWIGANVTILKDVTINHDSIIGSNSLVTKSVEESAVFAGIPAKKIRENVLWKRSF